MDYEKKYKDALKKAKDLHDNHALGMPFIYETCEQIFPELKESEDDRIRKEIIQFLRLPHPQFVGKRNHEEWFAWLEKQDKQRPSDKVEPKFKVGDWCINNEDNTTFQIMKVLSNLYYYRTNKGKEYSCTRDSIERDAHLWTIQDAKDGDILASKNKCPFIYKACKESDTKAYIYCCVSIYNNLCIGNDIFYCGYKESSKPATKEQRDLLFHKMKEAGYEWDAEKKELKKIEQKPAKWSEEDEKMCQETIDWFEKKCFPYALESQNPARESIKWLKSLKRRIK